MNAPVEQLAEDSLEAVVNLALEPVSLSENAIAFLSGQNNLKRWAVGKNPESMALHNLGLIEGIIDDSATPGQVWEEIPLIPMNDLPAGALVANCSSSIAPVSVQRKLLAQGLHPVPFCELIEAAKYSKGSVLKPAWFVTQQRSDWRLNGPLWIKLEEDLADEESRQTLRNLLRYRVSGNPAYMQGYSVRLQDQYFEDFLKFGNEVFVDAGGFDGDTTELFCQNVPSYRKVYLFEPSHSNMEAAKRRLANMANVEFHEVGVSNHAGELGFNPDAGSASSVGEEAEARIKVVRLDEAITEPVSYIKMDLEGWELPALQGASGLIEQYKPKLAIAVYHAAQDFLTIWQWVKTIMPECQVYLRHYTEGWSETVMYFVPATGE